MDMDKNIDGYTATFIADRPPPYEPNAPYVQAGPSAYGYSQLLRENHLNSGFDKPSAPAPSNFDLPNTVNTIQVAITDKFGPFSQNAYCPHCNQYVITKTKHTAGLVTWLSCFGLAMIGCFLCCCLMPFCINACRNVDHKCPKCKRNIGHFQRFCS